MLDLVIWYLLIALVGLLALPAAFRFFPFLADRGYIFARALGLILWGFAFWLLASLNILQNDSGGVLVALALLAALGAWLAGGRRGWRDIFVFLRSKLSLVVVTELLFLLAFVFLAVTRAASPDIANTEKPMEMAFINSILHSPSFPPADPWLSGYAISYYYFGYVMVSMLIRLSGVTVGVGFNLAISLWFALTALGAFGLSYSLLSLWSKHRQAQGKPGIMAQGWALLAPFYVLIVSNLGGFLTSLRDGGLFWQQVGGQWQSAFWQWLKIKEWATPPPQPFTWVPQGPGWWWWQSSRVVQDFRLNGDFVEVIDEFPFFSYFLADLHPHILGMPFVLLAIGLALNLYLWGSQLDFSELSLAKWVRKADFWVAAVVLGGLSFLNTWDFPIYLALFSAAFTLVRFRQQGWQWKERLKDFLKVALAFGIAGVALYLPFYIGFQSQAGGILPSLSFFTRGVYFWIMFAPLLIPLFAWLVWLAGRRSGQFKWGVGLRFAGILLVGLWVFSWLLGVLGGILPVIGTSMAASTSTGVANLGISLTNLGNLFISNQGADSTQSLLVGAFVNRLTSPGTWLTLGLLIAFVWSLLASYRFAGLAAPAGSVGISDPNSLGPSEPSETTPADVSGNSPETSIMESMPAARPEEKLPAAVDSSSALNPTPFILLLVLVGAGLTLAPEFVYLRDQFGARMNTVFKFYFQTWILWGVAAATISVFVLKELRRLSKGLFTAAWAIVLVLALAYPYFWISDRLSTNPVANWTLDGEASYAAFNPDDMAGIQWLRSAAYGTVVEAVGGQYSEYARVASHSGLPNVLGWPGHEIQWRGTATEQGSRETDIATLYSTSDWTQALGIIQRYNIRYIFIGSLERGKYKVNEQKFKAHLVPAFQQNSTTIYTVPDQFLNAKGTS